MFKRFFLLSCVTIAAIAKDAPADTIKISVSCYENIQKINEDGAKLSCYFKTAFEMASEKAKPTHKPSDLIMFLASRIQKTDEVAQLHYDIGYYFKDVMGLLNESRMKDLDKAFTQKYQETNNIKESWLWFAEHFKEKALAEPLAKLKQEIVSVDAELVKEGIFLYDDKKGHIIVHIKERAK